MGCGLVITGLPGAMMSMSSATLSDKVMNAVHCFKKNLESGLSKSLRSWGTALSTNPRVGIPAFLTILATVPRQGAIKGSQYLNTTTSGSRVRIFRAAFFHDPGSILESHW